MGPVPSCRRPGIEPFAYLREVLDRGGARPAGRGHDRPPDRRVFWDSAATPLAHLEVVTPSRPPG